MDFIFQPPEQPSKYSVKLETYNRESKFPYNELTYTCTVQQKKETLRGYIVNFKRSDLKLNRTNIHDPIDEIGLICGELLSDLDIGILPSGEILKIKNLSSIHEKWQNIKFKIEYTYLGDIVKGIVKNTEENIIDELRFIDCLCRDQFFYNFICNIYGNLSDKISSESELPSFAGMGALKIKKRFTVDKNSNNGGQILTCAAILSEETKHRLQAEKDTQDIEFIMTSEYSLSSDDRLIEAHVEQKFVINNELSAEQKVNIILETT